jgi:ATP-binding cassette subfamily F protein uup
MTYLTVENLSKSFGTKILFEKITFGLSKGDKTALVAPNGTGKSTLLKIIAGKEVQDTGEVMFQSDIKVGYLEQEPELNPDLTIQEYISQGHTGLSKVVLRYEKAVEAHAENFNEETQEEYMRASAAMDAAGAWDYEQRLEQILSRLDIHDLERSIQTLSGGERKRVALAFVLLDDPDLLILDEPTNHLDLDMIEWLEDYLAKSSVTLLMVTHDRYFLDRVCNHILEMDGGKLYNHNGNYAYYLQKKAER